MSRVLVVDDEQDYRDELNVGLSHAGHEVRTAATARDAIDVGARWRPDVLVADWMLKNDIHGLRVAETLRVVRPDLRTVLITGFGSPDLKAEAERFHVCEFIEKPFDLERIQAAVRDAAEGPAPPPSRLPIAVIDVDAAGRIVCANARARELFSETRAGAGAGRLDELFSPAMLAELDVAARHWVDVSPRAEGGLAWHVRARPWPQNEGRLVVLLSVAERDRKYHSTVALLLGIADAGVVRWPFDGRVLVVDRSEVVRRVVTAELEQAGCICHAAGDADVGLRLLHRDPDIQVVILDAHLPGRDIGEVVEKLRNSRPDAQIVGTGTEDCRSALSEAGIRRFLPKPFVTDDLVNLLTDRIGKCVDCGLPIPLRRLRPGDVGSSWECCGCGSRYFAVMDDRCASDILANVRAVEPPPPRMGASSD